MTPNQIPFFMNGLNIDKEVLNYWFQLLLLNPARAHEFHKPFAFRL